MKSRTFVPLLALLTSGCVTIVTNDPRNLPIDQVPMYGGMDRQSVPALKKGDEAFIASTSSAFGGQERAAKRWVDQAFVFYKRDNLEMAMRRFNQAWLLDPKNPEVYWGFGAVLHDRGLAFGAYDMEKRAYDLGLRDSGFLADLGRVATLRIIEGKDLSNEQKAAFIAESEAYYEAAVKTGTQLGYIFNSWSSAKYWRGDYSGAWDKIKAARLNGATENDHFISMLSQKMSDPK